MRNTKPGRGVPLTKEEKRKALELRQAGYNIGKIARELNRNRQTIGKFFHQQGTGNELEARVREQFLTEALKGHFQDLVDQIRLLKLRFYPSQTTDIYRLGPPSVYLSDPQEGILGLPAPGHPVFVYDEWYRMYGTPDTKSRYLTECLEEVHAKDSPFWRLQQQWERITQPYAEAVMAELVWLSSAVQDENLQKGNIKLKDNFTRVLAGHVLLVAGGEPGINAKDITIGSSQGQLALLCRDIAMVSAKERETLESVRGVFLHLCSVIQEQQWWPALTEGIQKIKAEQTTLWGLYRQIEDELDWLSLRRAFPGRCKLCPF